MAEICENEMHEEKVSYRELVVLKSFKFHK